MTFQSFKYLRHLDIQYTTHYASFATDFPSLNNNPVNCDRL